MKSMSGKEFAKLLESDGWELARINGSHHIFVKKGRIERISVPIHGNDDLKVGLLNHLLKMSGLKSSNYEKN